MLYFAEGGVKRLIRPIGKIRLLEEKTMSYTVCERIYRIGFLPVLGGLNAQSSVSVASAMKVGGIDVVDIPFDGNLTAWEKKQVESKSEKKMDKILLELRLAEVISRLSTPNCKNKEELEKEFERLIAQKNMLIKQ